MSSHSEIHEASAQPMIWSRGPEQPLLRLGEVHLWRASLDDPQLFEALDMLSLTEIIRAEQCASERERDRCVAQRVFLRGVVSRYLDVAPDEIELGEIGSEPTCIPSSLLHVTASQSEELALVAISASSGVGLDVEQVRPDLPFEEMAEHFLDPVQQWGLRITFSSQEKAWKFFDFWTTSEACFRANPMHSRQPASQLSLHRLSPADGFLAAVAVSGGSSRLALWDWN